MKRMRVLALLVMVLLVSLLPQTAWGGGGNDRDVKVSHHLWLNRAEVEVNLERVLSWFGPDCMVEILHTVYAFNSVTGDERILVFGESLTQPVQPRIHLVADWDRSPVPEGVSLEAEGSSLFIMSEVAISLHFPPEMKPYLGVLLGTYYGWVVDPPRYTGPVEIGIDVVDHLGGYVEGANVEIGAYMEERDPHFEEIAGVTVSRETDENGKVSFTVPAPTEGLTYGTRTTYEDETGKKYEETSWVSAWNGGKFSACVRLYGLCLKPTERLVVRVTDGNGQPVNGATVYLGRRVGFLEFTRFDMPSKLTADGGSVVFESVPDLCILFTAEASFRGHKSTSLYSQVQDGTQLLQVNLPDLRLSE